MKRVPTVKPYSRRTMRALAIAQGLLILVSLMVPITDPGRDHGCHAGTQAPNPVTAGNTTTYTVQVTTGIGLSRAGSRSTSISGLPAGASLQSLHLRRHRGQAGRASLTVVVATTVATAGGNVPDRHDGHPLELRQRATATTASRTP